MYIDIYPRSIDREWELGLWKKYLNLSVVGYITRIVV